jgi:hypothetical protein|tara:strand:- start:221 stop:400 length:180 start_codon:yes stop_codon:yes gene_type:complete
MVKFLSEVNMADRLESQFKKALSWSGRVVKKDKKPSMLEEQIRDSIPYEIDEVEENEKL